VDWTDHPVDNTAAARDISKVSSRDDYYLYISYRDSQNKNLKFAKCNDPSQLNFNDWEIQTIDDTSNTGYFSSIASDGTNIYIAYYNETSDDLRFIKNTNSGASQDWSTPITIDSTGTVGKECSIVLTEDNIIYISYVDSTNHYLKLARSTDSGTNWDIIPVDESGDVADVQTDIEVVDGTIYIVYAENISSSVRNLKIAKSSDNGNTW